MFRSVWRSLKLSQLVFAADQPYVPMSHYLRHSPAPLSQRTVDLQQDQELKAPALSLHLFGGHVDMIIRFAVRDLCFPVSP